MDIEAAKNTHDALNAIHPLLGKLFLFIGILLLGMGYTFKTDLPIAAGCISSGIASGYYTWRWVHEYKLSKKAEK